ncbi:MAG TPA: hypothetical protein ENJ19_03300 [Gammaproteobacteria bacterium]|nr:hypothetical protein [Gammaproteobacteria bacterium]
MAQAPCPAPGYGSPALDNLDRGVALAALGGAVANGIHGSLAGILLTVAAALVYSLARNRIANNDDFSGLAEPPRQAAASLRFYRPLCLWLGSVHIYCGLLGDMVGVSHDQSGTQWRNLRDTLYLVLWTRFKEKLLTLMWLDHKL